MPSWFDELRRNRQDFVRAARANNFEGGIWRASVDKYAEPVHFLLELLQNAEDQGARRAIFTVDSEQIIFEHDGSSFTQLDVENITGIGNTEKPQQANKIGCFGIGFKSVFVATDRPEIHTDLSGDPFAFAICDLVIPERIERQDIRRGLTRFVLPLKPALKHSMVESVQQRLEELGPRVLLFLKSIQQLTWNCGNIAAAYKREVDADGAVVLKRIGAMDSQPALRYLTFQRKIPHLWQTDNAVHTNDTARGQRNTDICVAFRLGIREILPEDRRARAFVFFETQEETGLFFLLHGPFLLTDNRANIKRNDATNERLVSELAALVSEALHTIRDRGLLTRSFLAVLPNSRDDLPIPWNAVAAHILNVMRSEQLVPTVSDTHERADRLRRGSAQLRSLLSDDALALFCGLARARWAVAGLRNAREERFLEDLEIPEWTLDDFVVSIIDRLGSEVRNKLALHWLESRSDAEVRNLYLLLNDVRLSKHQLLKFVPLVRLEDNRHVLAQHAFFAPAQSKDDDLHDVILAFVKADVLRGGDRTTDLLGFLRKIGVKDVDETAYGTALLKRFYGPAPAPVTKSQHRSHIRRFVELWEKSKDAAAFRDYDFLLGSDEKLTPADRLYIDSPYQPTGLDHVYARAMSGKAQRKMLWLGYSRMTIGHFTEFAIAVGVHRTIPVRRKSTRGHPKASYLRSVGGNYVASTSTDVDYDINELEALLVDPDELIAKCIWATMDQAPAAVLHAMFQPNRSSSTRTADSSLVLRLRAAAWIPDKSGHLRQPNAMTYGELATGFSVGPNREWLEAIGFASDEQQRSAEHKERVEGAKGLGVPDGLAEIILKLPDEVRSRLWNDLERLVEEGRAESVAQSLPTFPKHTSSDPARRAERAAQRAHETQEKRFEKRERQVRLTDASVVEQTKAYLRSMYTNDDGKLVCQVCQNEMPFRLENGNYYFEAVECLVNFDRECSENHLALCPVCAAKYLYANKTDWSFLAEALRSTEDLLVNVVLAGEAGTIRFVQDHRNDLASILRALLTPASGDNGRA